MCLCHKTNHQVNCTCTFVEKKIERNETCPEHQMKDIGERWLVIKSQAQDSGIHRVNTWLKQRNPKILNARAILCRGGKPTLNPETVKEELEISVPTDRNDQQEGPRGWTKYVAPTDHGPRESVLRDHYGLVRMLIQ